MPLVIDWQIIAQYKEHYVNENIRRSNPQRRQYDYCQGQQVLEKVHNPTKVEVRSSGPFINHVVHVNGTITIQLHPSDTKYINTRRILPFC